MKKLLHTVLITFGLLALSPPNHAGAQTATGPTTKTFTITPEKIADGTVTIGKRVKAATGGDRTDLTLSDMSWDASGTLSGDLRYGWGRIVIKENAAEGSDALVIDFDFSDCAAAAASIATPFKATNKLSATTFQVAEGARMRLSMLSGKPIKSIVFSTAEGSAPVYISQSTQLLANLRQGLHMIKSLNGNFPSQEFKVTGMGGSATRGNATYCREFTVSSPAPAGSAEPLVWQIADSKNGELGSLDYQYLNFQDFTVTYGDDADGRTDAIHNHLTYGADYATPIYYKDGDATEWTKVTGTDYILLDGATVRVKFGQAVTTFLRPDSPKAGQHTVVINPNTRTIGATVGVRFFTELDPDFTTDDHTLYQVEYLLGVKASSTPTTNIRRQAANMTPPDAAITYGADTFDEEACVLGGISVAGGLTQANSTFTVNDPPAYYPWYNAPAYENNINGKDESVAFDGIRISFSSTQAGPVQQPMAPRLTMPDNTLYDSRTGTYKALGTADISVDIDEAETYRDVKVYFIKSQSPVDESNFDRYNPRLVTDGLLDIYSSGYFTFRATSTSARGEVHSGVVSRRMEYYDVKDVDYMGHLGDVKRGQLVRLNFPLQVIASGMLGDKPGEFQIFARDGNNNPVRLVTRFNDMPGDISEFVPSSAFLSTADKKIFSQPFVPAGGVVGTIEFEYGKPVIVLKDEAEGIDNFDLCYKGAPMSCANVPGLQGGVNYVRNTYIANRRTSVSLTDINRLITIDVDYDATMQSFTGAGSGESVVIYLNPQFQLLNQGVNAFRLSWPEKRPVTSGRYTATGIVAYDNDLEQYYLIPRTIVPAPAFPGVKVVTHEGYALDDDSFFESPTKKSATAYIENGEFLYNILISGSDDSHSVHVGWNDSNGQRTDLAYTDNSGYDITSQFPHPSTFTDGTLDMEIRITDSSEGSPTGGNSNNMIFASSEPYRLRVYDRVGGAPVYTSIAAVLKDARERPSELNGTFIHLKGDALALASVNDYKTANGSETNNMLLKDITPLKAGLNPAALDCLPLKFDFPLYRISSRYCRDSGLWIDGTPETGDSIAELTFRLIIDESGNATGDLTDWQEFFKSYKASRRSPSDPGYNPDMRVGQPIFAAYFDKLAHGARIADAASQQLGADHIDKVVTLDGVTIVSPASVRQAAPRARAASAPARAYAAPRATAGFMAKMKVDVPLQWSVFATSESSMLNREIIASLDPATPYTITGLVRDGGNGSHFIEVMDLTPGLSKVVAVCDHPHHDTYYDSDAHTLTDAMVGTAVELKGMTLRREGSTATDYRYLTATRQPVLLNFDAVPTKADAWKALADEAATAGSGPQPTVRLTGVLRLTPGDTPAAPYTIDVNTYENVSPVPSSDLRLTFNGHAWNDDTPGFYSSGKLGYEAPEGTTVYYTLLDNTDEDATDDEIAAMLQQGEEKLFTAGTDISIDHTVWIRLSACTPGHTPQTPVVVKMEKLSADIATLADAISAAGTSQEPAYYRNNAPWLVTRTSGTHTIVTDGSGINVALASATPGFTMPAAGSYIGGFAIAKGLTDRHPDYTYSLDVAGNRADALTTGAPATPIPAPEIKELTSLSTDAHKGMLVGLTGVNIIGNGTIGYRIKAIATAGTPDDSSLASGPNAQAYDFTTLRDIDLENALDADLDQLLDNDDEATYRLVGYAMADTDKLAPAGATVDDDAKYNILEFWPVEIIRRRQLEAPVITLSADRSTVAATAIITCLEEGALIEYSTDGGATWAAYTGPITLDATATLLARATKPWLDGSDVATASFTLLRPSADPLAEFKQSEGLTEVTLTSSRQGAAPESYRIFYTLDGTEPTSASTPYTGPIRVKAAATVLKALLIESATDATPSAVITWSVPFTPAGQSEQPGQSAMPLINRRTDADGTVWVELKAPDGADTEAIYFTTDGTEPTESSAVYTGEIKVTKTLTVKAALKERGKSLSPTASLLIEVGTTGSGATGADTIGRVSVDGNSIIAPAGSEAYDMTGRRVGLNGLRRGVYIVRLPDGTSVKVSVL